MNAASFEGWFPFRIALDEARDITVDWFYLGRYRLQDDRFFSDTLGRCARHPFNLIFRRRTGVAELDAVAARGAAPDGLIFHLSRCGSTLAAQMLAAHPGAFVLSEPGPLNDVVTLPADALDEVRRASLLRATARALGVHAPPGARFAIKLDAWHARRIALFERAFPNVPWFFVYRDPLEVLISHMMTQSYMMSAANAPAALGMPVTEAVRLSHPERCAAVIAAIDAAVIARAPRAEQLVNYDALVSSVIERMAPAFGIVPDDDQLRAMHGVRAFHAKHPGAPFEDDRAAKRAAAAPDVIAFVEQHLAPLHAALERLRTRT